MMSTAMRVLLAIGTCAATAAHSAAPVPHYVVARQIAGSDGGWDYASFDPVTHRLYVAHNAAVTEVSVASSDKVRSFGTIAKAHAVVPIPGQPLLLVTSGHDDSVRLLDTHDGHEVANIPVGSDPDAAFFEASSGRAVVMNAKAGTVSVIDLASRKVVRTITLKPALEFGVAGKDGALFVNNEELGEIETADLSSGQAGTAIPMPGCEGPTGLGYDAQTDRLISACANGKAAVVDAHARRLVALVDIGRGPDGALLDPAHDVVLIPCGQDGVLEVLRLGATVTRSAPVMTERGARTGAIDPVTGTVYLPTARFAPPAPGVKRPAALPESFHFVVVQAG